MSCPKKFPVITALKKVKSAVPCRAQVQIHRTIFVFANVCNVCNIVDDSKSSEKLNQRVGGLNICPITITIRIIPREYEYLGKSLAEKSMTNVMSDENCFEKKKKNICSCFSS